MAFCCFMSQDEAPVIRKLENAWCCGGVKCNDVHSTFRKYMWADTTDELRRRTDLQASSQSSQAYSVTRKAGTTIKLKSQ
jgi:hypothetical protein